MRIGPIATLQNGDTEHTSRIGCSRTLKSAPLRAQALQGTLRRGLGADAGRERTVAEPCCVSGVSLPAVPPSSASISDDDRPDCIRITQRNTERQSFQKFLNR